MDIVRGPKPFTEAERAFAGEKAALVKKEVDAFAACPPVPEDKPEPVREHPPAVASGFKFCTKCERVKPTDEFHRNKATKDGRCTQCKECTNAACRAYLARIYGRTIVPPAPPNSIEETRRIHSVKRRAKYFQPGRE